MLTLTRTAVSVGMAPAGSKVTLDPATFMLSNKRFIGCTEGDSVPYEVCCWEASTEKMMSWLLLPRQLSPHLIDYSFMTDFVLVHTKIDQHAETRRLPNREALHVLFLYRDRQGIGRHAQRKRKSYRMSTYEERNTLNIQR